MENSFHGLLAEVEGVSVDNFAGINLKSRAYFLSHGHSDHFQGIEDMQLLNRLATNNKIQIYMTEITSEILRNMTSKYNDVKHYIKILNIGTETVKLPSLDAYKEEYLTVTVIPAGHCPGSVMFLFQNCKDLVVLYTGDFRITKSDIQQFKQLHTDSKQPKKIHALYLDTTFLSLEYEHFPKRRDCVKELCSCIRKWLDANANNRIFLSLSARFGYEFIFVEIFENLCEKILVDFDKIKAYRKMPSVQKAVTTDSTQSRIHITELKQTNYNYLKLRLSAQAWQNYQPGDSTVRELGPKIFQVCFPTHCSRSEIMNFIAYFKPDKITGFPNPFVEFDKCFCDNFDGDIVASKKKKLDSSSYKGGVSKEIKNMFSL